MNRLRSLFLIILLLALCAPARAIITGELIMLRSPQPFSDTLERLVSAIERQGFTVTGIRAVDRGLERAGYSTDEYRVVFFENKDETAFLTERYPEMVPYLPLKIVIYAEADETLVVTSDPAVFIDLYPSPRLRDMFRRWHDEVVSIMRQVQDGAANEPK